MSMPVMPLPKNGPCLPGYTPSGNICVPTANAKHAIAKNRLTLGTACALVCTSLVASAQAPDFAVNAKNISMKAPAGMVSVTQLTVTSMRAVTSVGEEVDRIVINDPDSSGVDSESCTFHRYSNGKWMSVFEAEENGADAKQARWRPLKGQTAQLLVDQSDSECFPVRIVRLTRFNPNLDDIVLNVK